MTTKYFCEFSNLPLPELGLGAETYKISFQFSGGHTPIELKAGDTPLRIAYADGGDDIFSPIRAKKATIQLIATEGIDLDAFYAQSDRECLVVIERGSEVIFRGWLTAFDAREPFLCRPYTFELVAHCGLSSLKDFNFAATGLISFNDAIKQCLLATGLNLNYQVGIDTRISGDTGDPTTLYGFEAEALNGKTCYDALTQILESFVADVEQSAGKWVIRGVSEQAEGAVSVYEYSAGGGVVGGSTSGAIAPVGRGTTRRNITGAEVQKEPAISYVEIKYDLGALRNLLPNGSFTEQTFLGAYNYDNWDRYNGIVGSKQSPSGVKISGRCKLWYINEDGTKVLDDEGKVPWDLKAKFLGYYPAFLDTKYYESHAIALDSAQKVIVKGKFQPKYVDFARLEVYIYDSAIPTQKLWLTQDGEWKEQRDFMMLDYTKQVVRVYGDDPAPLVWYPFEITSQDIPTKRSASEATASGTRPYTTIRYNTLRIRVFSGVYNNTVASVGSDGDAYVIYDDLRVNFNAKNEDKLLLTYGFRNANYVRKNPLNVSIPFGGYSVATTGGAGRIREASLNNYASVIRRMSGAAIVDAWTKAGQGVLSDFVRLNGISRLRLGHKFGYSWEGDIVGQYFDSVSRVTFDTVSGAFKPTSYEYDFKRRTASVTLKQLISGSFSYVEGLQEGSATGGGAIATTITNGSGKAKITDPDAFTDRGLISEPIDFDTLTDNGEYRIEAEGGVWTDWEHAPLFAQPFGRLRVFETEGAVMQYYYPEVGGVHWREYSYDETEEDYLWLPSGGWNIAAEGMMLSESTEDEPEPKYVTVVDSYNRGIASGMAIQVPTIWAFEKQSVDAFIDRSGVNDPTEVTTPSNFNAFTSDGGDYLISLTTWTGSTNAPTALAVGGRLTVEKVDGAVIQRYQQGGSILKRTRLKKNKDGTYTWEPWEVDTESPIETFVNDFNEMVEMGAYHIATATIPDNAPDGAATGGMLHVFITDGELMQRYYVDGEIYLRKRLGGTWEMWEAGAAGVMFDTEASPAPDTVEITTEYVDGVALAATVSVYTQEYIDNLTTTDIPEPASDIVNKYFTNARARAAISAGTGLSYDPTTGVMSYTGASTAISAVAPLYYNSTTGALTWGGTTADVPESGGYLYYTDTRARAAFSAGAGISIVGGVISATGGSYSDAQARAAISVAGGILSYNSTTGVITLSASAYDSRYVQFAGSYTNPSWLVAFAWSKITGTPTTISGYGITNAYTKTEVDALVAAVSGLPSGGTVNDYLRGDRTWSVLDTLAVVESPVRLYFTNARARAALSAGTGLTYNSTTGQFASTISQYTDALARAAISAGTGISYNASTGVISSTITQYTDAQARASVSATGNISYNSTTGVISTSLTQYTDAMARAAFSAGTGINIGVGGVISSTITQYTDAMARAAFSAGTGISIVGGVISATGSGVSGSGTTPYIPKWTSAGAIGNSIMADDGTGIVIGGTASGGYKLRVQGAIYADGDGSAVALYLGSGRAIRSLGEMYIDSPGGNTYFRNGAGYAYSMTLNPSGYVLMGTVTATGSKTLQVNGGIRATGQMQFASYTNAVSYTGVRAGLLGFTSGGDIISVADTDFATTGHNHNGDYYTKTQLNTSGAGGAVHWDNVTNKPSVGLTPHTHPIGEVIGLQTALDGKTPWGHNHDDRYYTESESDARYLQSESDPHGFNSHWFSVSGSTVTLGIQKRNGAQQYANFNVPSTGGGADYSLALSSSPPGGLGTHQIFLNKSTGGSSNVIIYEQDPYGLTDVSASYNNSTKVLTLYHNLRNGTTKTLSVILA